ncbi:MAG: anaerobic sulfatase-maturation protein [Acidobacteria bacterium]|nr:anaerobic sulfatase-maturation protein [Acidobacteriota bacterium]
MQQQDSGFHILAKPIGPVCNLGCRYCFYLEKEALYPAKTGIWDWVMPDEILEEFIRQYIKSQDAPVVNFAWQGGEPTMLGVDYFRKAVELQKKHANGVRIENTIQTNGILLDDTWCEFLAENDFLVGLSLDGPQHLHDRYRMDKGGAPSFDRVMLGVKALKKHGVEFNTLTVVPRHNADYPLEIYRFLREIGHGFMQFIPIVERAAAEATPEGLLLVSPDSETPAKVSEWSVDPLQYGRFLSAIFDDWVRSDVGKVYIQIFDVTLAAWVGMEPALCVFQKTCGSSAVIEHNGDIYSCDHYVYPENRLGNIMDQPLESMVRSARQAQFGKKKLDSLPRQCLDCGVRFVCNGECPKHRFVKAGKGGGDLNYLCRGYKAFFTHVKPYMDFMAAELREKRPPANVMLWLRQREMAEAGRNDPCPCGSGKKFKRCCGR